MTDQARSPVESFETRGDAVDRYQYDESLLAVADGIYVGYITIAIFTYDSKENPEIDVKMVEVLAGYRRRGVASALYEEMEKKLRVERPRWDGVVRTGFQTEDGAAFFSSVTAL